MKYLDYYFFGGITVGLWLTIFQELNLNKKLNDKEIEKLEVIIQNNKLVTAKTLEQLESCIISNLNKGE